MKELAICEICANRDKKPCMSDEVSIASQFHLTMMSTGMVESSILCWGFVFDEAAKINLESWAKELTLLRAKDSIFDDVEKDYKKTIRGLHDDIDELKYEKRELEDKVYELEEKTNDR